MGRFAERTKVPVERSKSELDQLLQKHGATQRALLQDDDTGRAAVQFRLADRMIRLELVCPGGTKGGERIDRERRRIWRALLLLVKAKLEMVADGATTVEREFLADILLPDGKRVHELLGPQLVSSYKSGKMPPLLPPVGG